MIYDDILAALSVIQSPGNRLQVHLVLLCFMLLSSTDAAFFNKLKERLFTNRKIMTCFIVVKRSL